MPPSVQSECTRNAYTRPRPRNTFILQPDCAPRVVVHVANNFTRGLAGGLKFDGGKKKNDCTIITVKIINNDDEIAEQSRDGCKRTKEKSKTRRDKSVRF